MNDYHSPNYDPTPSEIRAACRNLQRGWSEEQERNRQGLRGRPVAYSVPVLAEDWLPGGVDPSIET